MSFNFQKSLTLRLAQAAKAHRTRSGALLAKVGLHAGQETLLKLLSENDGYTMSRLAEDLGVQPPTVTKMISRLSVQGFVERRYCTTDGRLTKVYLTAQGVQCIETIDKIWMRLEEEAFAGLEAKDKRDLERILNRLEQNLLSGGAVPTPPESYSATKPLDSLEHELAG
ncbi:MarR family winged helix-turn-helix transcriptional regulator [Flexibacterium corallicola]|uniref:MarR family winged helix-turn-helix transcriptional regulator n=1 Tax=Flexibacterium corallicola TaxID=3037259 RepID=UPI00286ED1FE|nr:MarR family winged helix-turn-helix transcriptional regulator [Pseudovibrio sp. M1P-2-3]